MSFIKRISKLNIFRFFACFIIAQYIRLVRYTGRWEIRSHPESNAMLENCRPFIFCFWHGRLLMMPYGWQYRKLARMLISQHRDGLLISQTVAHFGIKTISVSSKQSGFQALYSIIKLLKKGEHTGFTPDGPRGPRMRVHPGIIQAAKLSNVPIIPVSYSARRRKVLRSWDRFVFPLPFSGGVILHGAPIIVPPRASKAEMEIARCALEDSLNELTAECDYLCGHESIEPAEKEAAIP